MNIKTRLEQFNRKSTAIIADDTGYTYGDLIKAMDFWKRTFKPGGLVSIHGHTMFVAIAKMLKALDDFAIVAPMVELRKSTLWNKPHEHYTTIRKRNVPGLILFTSGSSGEPKVAVHDVFKLMAKWKIHYPEGWKPSASERTICLLDFDHIGGLNTIFHTLFNGGCVVFPKSRKIEDVAYTIDKHQVKILPTSPTFLNLLALKCESDLSSVSLITYGTEPMPESTLKAICYRFPQARVKQTYGMTEIGIMSTKSRDNDSTWMQIREEYRIVDEKLEIKHNGSFVGYLNAPSPVTADGYYKTGDRVLTSGGWLRIIGRDSDFINVGGNKVHPVEIEDEILDCKSVIDCIVEGEKNPIMGEIIKATIYTEGGISWYTIRDWLKFKNFPLWKIPQRIVFTFEPLHSSRCKKVRHNCLHSESSDAQIST